MPRLAARAPVCASNDAAASRAARAVLLDRVMLGKTILVHTSDKLGARRLSGHLRAAGNEVLSADAASAACDLLGANAVDLVFVDVAAAASRDVVAAARANGAPVVVLSAAGDPSVMLDFVCEQEVEHFLARADEPDGGMEPMAREVVVTAEKILRGDLFGIEKYLPAFGVEIATTEVRGATDRDDLVECISDHVGWLGAGSEARRAVSAVADELVTNAVYDAPRGADGVARYAAVDRRQKITLDPWEHVTVRWGSDGDRLAVSVTDWFGALRAEHVRAGLRRCLTHVDPIEQKAGGAGLGLYTALAYSAQLVVNVERGARTEIIAVIDLRRGHGLRRGGRSLHLFVDEARTRAVTDATPRKVEVSHSMLADVRAHLVPAARASRVVPLTRRRGPVRAEGSTPPPAPATPAPAAPERRPSTAPFVEEPVDADTACGLLHGSTEVPRALRIALRYLSHHYQGAIAYCVDGPHLDATHAAGRLTDWPTLKKLRLLSSGPASIATLARTPGAHAFEPSCPLDYRVALWTAGRSESPGLVLPIHVASTLRWVLYAAGPRPDAFIVPDALDRVRAELERALLRLDADEPEIDVRWG